jgi:hypothetical protein
VTAESSTRQLTAVLDPLWDWLSSLRPLVVSYGDEAAALLADGCRLVRRLEDSGDVEAADSSVVRSLAELASDMCPSETTHGLLHRLAIHLDPAHLGSPSFHLAFECRILVRASEQYLSLCRAADDLTALVLAVCTTDILADLDEDPDAVLADGRTITPSSAYLFLAALDADSTAVNMIAVLDSIAATHSPYYHAGSDRVEKSKRVRSRSNTTRACATNATPPSLCPLPLRLCLHIAPVTVVLI